MITPLQEAPELVVKLVGGGTWKLAKQKPENFTMVVFYRGLHCPVCKSYTEELQKQKAHFQDLGINIIAISMDSSTLAHNTKNTWNVSDLPFGFGLTTEQAKAWGLYLSKGINDKEPDLFSEPGLFLIRPNNEVYYVAINSQPFGRPHLRSFAKSLAYIVNNNYPSRGEVVY